MPALELTQRAMQQALDHGPDHLPEGLFAGPHARIMAGFKTHANTISHARLIALEETFPRTLAWMGHARFNEHSRLYLEQPGVTARALTHIGKEFPSFLHQCGAARAAAELARFEWLWLEAYHAADSPPLRLAGLAGIETHALMDIVVQAHPAASLSTFDAAVHRLLGEEVPGAAVADAILLTRPGADVLVSPADAAMRRVFPRAGNPDTIGNLLAGANEPDCKDQLSPDGLMGAFIALLEAGALQQAAAKRADWPQGD